MSNGRPRGIPEWAWAEVFQLYDRGLGYRAVANALIPEGVFTSKSTVERLIKGLPPCSTT